jgi:hypothetical protein
MSKKISINCYNCGEVCEVTYFGEGSHRQWCAECKADRAKRYEEMLANKEKKESDK